MAHSSAALKAVTMAGSSAALKVLRLAALRAALKVLLLAVSMVAWWATQSVVTMARSSAEKLVELTVVLLG
jgi:hypothetical protein